MIALSSGPIQARGTERCADELLNELFKSHFTGNPHPALLGNVTFPLCELYFNQASISAPEALPQIHTVLTKFKPSEQWFAAGDLSAWVAELAEPIGGVNYGLTDSVGGCIEEAVAGKLCRRFPGEDIRWRYDSQQDALLEEILSGGQWTALRSFPGANAIEWIKTAPNVFEERITSPDGAWQTLRQILTASLWDGSKKLVTAEALFSIFVRVRAEGAKANSADMSCRAVADNVKELFERTGVRTELAAKGMRHARIIAGPTPLESKGLKVRHLVLEAKMRYFLPVL